MSNRPWNRIGAMDRHIRSLSPNRGMTAEPGKNPQIRITLIRGFELFNTRPYHNYETWSDGYRVEAFDENGQIFAIEEREDLNDALDAIEPAIRSYHAKDDARVEVLMKHYRETHEAKP